MPVPKSGTLTAKLRNMVGRVTPCAPGGSALPNCGAHGVTRPTMLRNSFASVPRPAFRSGGLVPPHPRPLPWGEGGPSTAPRQIEAPKPIPRRSAGHPLPKGEGGVRGNWAHLVSPESGCQRLQQRRDPRGPRVCRCQNVLGCFCSPKAALLSCACPQASREGGAESWRAPSGTQGIGCHSGRD